MSYKLRGTNLGLIVGALAVLTAIATVRHPGPLAYQHATPVPSMNYDLRTSGGLPLASIFEGLTGSNIDVAVVNALVAEAKEPPRDPCHKKAKNSWSTFLDAFAPTSVFAQCSSDCTSHYNGTRYVNSDCIGLTVCMYGPVYYYGCKGELFDCGDNGYACGQTTCPNP
jgi:hypothetical protein